MRGIELLNRHPFCRNAIFDWYVSKFIENLRQADVPEEYKERLSEIEIDDDQIATLVDNNPRSLFDLFDENNVFIDIDYFEGSFWWKVGNGINMKNYTNRISAERDAIIEAFKILEDVLTNAK
jgi:polyribonucleotide nucleotidyltransferase